MTDVPPVDAKHFFKIVRGLGGMFETFGSNVEMQFDAQAAEIAELKRRHEATERNACNQAESLGREIARYKSMITDAAREVLLTHGLLRDAQEKHDELRKRAETQLILGALRLNGWAVAVHNDYRLNGKAMTFWLFTHASGRFVKGEGMDDHEALTQALKSTEPEKKGEKSS